MNIEQFLPQLGMGILWSIIQPQIPFLLTVAGFVVAWQVLQYVLRLWGGRPNE